MTLHVKPNMEGFPQTQVSACVAHSYAHWPTARLHNRHTYKIIIIILFDQSCNVTHVFIFILFFYSHQCGFTLLRVNAFHDASLPCEAVVVFMFYISTTMRSILSQLQQECGSMQVEVTSHFHKDLKKVVCVAASNAAQRLHSLVKTTHTNTQ